MRFKLALGAILATLALCACGSGTGGAASCLKYALNSGNGPGSCKQTPAGRAQARMSSLGPGAKSVTCTNKTRNEYACRATMGDGSHQFYDVTYNRKTIAYQSK
jgi:hypothetical protein